MHHLGKGMRSVRREIAGRTLNKTGQMQPGDKHDDKGGNTDQIRQKISCLDISQHGGFSVD